MMEDGFDEMSLGWWLGILMGQQDFLCDNERATGLPDSFFVGKRSSVSISSPHR
jgi:hypothetical protein